MSRYAFLHTVFTNSGQVAYPDRRKSGNWIPNMSEPPKLTVEYVLFDMDGLLPVNIFSNIIHDTCH